jgi:hypothetical protein
MTAGMRVSDSPNAPFAAIPSWTVASPNRQMTAVDPPYRTSVPVEPRSGVVVQRRDLTNCLNWFPTHLERRVTPTKAVVKLLVDSEDIPDRSEDPMSIQFAPHPQDTADPIPTVK